MPSIKCSHPGCEKRQINGSKYCSHHKLVHSGWAYDCKSCTVGVKKPQRGALVYDPMCADPYRMSADKAREHLKADEFYVGTVLLIGNERVEVR